MQAVIGITFSSAKCARQNGKYAIDWKMRQQFKNQPFPQHDVHDDFKLIVRFPISLSFVYPLVINSYLYVEGMTNKFIQGESEALFLKDRRRKF